MGRGPEEIFKEGIVKLAQLSGAPLVPIAWAAKRAWILRTWDHFVLPKPFTRIVVVVGAPIAVPRDADAAQVETLRLAAQNALQALFKTARADSHDPRATHDFRASHDARAFRRDPGVQRGREYRAA